MMTEDDSVNLIIVLRAGGFLPLLNMTRKHAMENIKHWWDLRELVRNGNEEAAQFFRNGTLAGRIGNFADHWAVAWGSIDAMYIQEQVMSPQERAMKAVEKMSKKAMEHMEEGEDWKDKGDEDE